MKRAAFEGGVYNRLVFDKILLTKSNKQTLKRFSPCSPFLVNFSMKEREIKAVPSQSDRHFQIRSDTIVVSFFISGVLRFQEQQVKISLIRFEKETSDRSPVSFCKIPPSTSLQLKRRKRTPSKKQSGSNKSNVFHNRLDRKKAWAKGECKPKKRR